jgi:hypothetical protein
MISTAQAQEKQIFMGPVTELSTAQFIDYLIPRFSLKHNIKISLPSENTPPDVVISEDTGAIPIFKNDQTIWFLTIVSRDPHGYAEKFSQWLTSNTGKRTVENYQSDFGGKFSARFDLAKNKQIDVSHVDISLGQKLAAQNCGRCHATDKTNRMKTIGSTPSFAALRTFKDWQIRFEVFFTLNPHPSFTQIEDVTPPFDRTLPSPIEPITLTLDDLDEIMKFVSQITPADLGLAVQSQ